MNSELVASQLVLWQPTRERKNGGRQRATYVDTLLKDTELNTVEEVANRMGIRIAFPNTLCMHVIKKPSELA